MSFADSAPRVNHAYGLFLKKWFQQHRSRREFHRCKSRGVNFLYLLVTAARGEQEAAHDVVKLLY
ncbi:MAG TPA: hypothetical protein VFU57_08965 [Candidatus Acidoferrales bacterium]|nr:hypothetical protein [Candidatus Acidoferrales bacterium]